VPSCNMASRILLRTHEWEGSVDAIEKNVRERQRKNISVQNAPQQSSVYSSTPRISRSKAGPIRRKSILRDGLTFKMPRSNLVFTALVQESLEAKRGPIRRKSILGDGLKFKMSRSNLVFTALFQESLEAKRGRSAGNQSSEMD
jgi:hypothetical protein